MSNTHKVAKALAHLTVTEFVDGVSTDGVVNISNLITIKGDHTDEVKVRLSNEGLTIYVGKDLVYET